MNEDKTYRLEVQVPYQHLLADEDFFSLEDFLTKRLEEYGVHVVSFEED